MSDCKWSPEVGDYLRDGEPCRRDDYGDPTRHCTARRTCSNHVAASELSCARCIARTRQDIRWIRDYAALLPTAALSDGVNSEAANLAGPACDPEAWSWRKIAAKQGTAWHVSLIEDDDDWHPYTVLTRWSWMLREDYGQGAPTTETITTAAVYLDRHLHRIAQDDEQDFPLLRREVRKCRQHLENVLHDSSQLERGAPCPICHGEDHFARLQREYAHWCWDEDCERIHYATDEGDRWVCPRKREHAWTEKAYRQWIEERAG